MEVMKLTTAQLRKIIREEVDAATASTDTRMESAYRELIKTPVTIGHFDVLAAAYRGA